MNYFARDQQMAEAYRSGQTLRQVGERFGVSGARVQRILVKLGVERRVRGWLSAPAAAVEARRVRAKYRMLEFDRRRNDAIAQAVANGATFLAAGRQFGVSRNAVAGVVYRARRRAERAA